MNIIIIPKQRREMQIECYKQNEINGQSNIDTSLRIPEKHYCQVNVPLQQSGQLKNCVSFNIQIKLT